MFKEVIPNAILVSGSTYTRVDMNYFFENGMGVLANYITLVTLGTAATSLAIYWGREGGYEKVREKEG